MRILIIDGGIGGLATAPSLDAREIDDVIARDELETMLKSYATAAGFGKEQVNSRSLTDPMEPPRVLMRR